LGDFGLLQIWQTTGATLIGDPAADLTCSCSTCRFPPQSTDGK